MKRKDDPTTKTRFRSIRVFKEVDGYYFDTREGQVCGPFDNKVEANSRVEVYIKVMDSNLISTDSGLTLEPSVAGIAKGG